MTDPEDERLRIMFRNTFEKPNGFGLAWIIEQWGSGELREMRSAASSADLDDLASTFDEAIALKAQIDDLPGETDDPGYLAWEARVNAVQARMYEAGVMRLVDREV